MLVVVLAPPAKAHWIDAASCSWSSMRGRIRWHAPPRPVSMGPNPRSGSPVSVQQRPWRRNASGWIAPARAGGRTPSCEPDRRFIESIKNRPTGLRYGCGDLMAQERFAEPQLLVMNENWRCSVLDLCSTCRRQGAPRSSVLTSARPVAVVTPGCCLPGVG